MFSTLGIHLSLYLCACAYPCIDEPSHARKQSHTPEPPKQAYLFIVGSTSDLIHLYRTKEQPQRYKKLLQQEGFGVLYPQRDKQDNTLYFYVEKAKWTSIISVRQREYLKDISRNEHYFLLYLAKPIPFVTRPPGKDWSAVYAFSDDQILLSHTSSDCTRSVLNNISNLLKSLSHKIEQMRILRLCRNLLRDEYYNSFYLPPLRSLYYGDDKVLRIETWPDPPQSPDHYSTGWYSYNPGARMKPITIRRHHYTVKNGRVVPVKPDNSGKQGAVLPPVTEETKRHAEKLYRGLLDARTPVHGKPASAPIPYSYLGFLRGFYQRAMAPSSIFTCYRLIKVTKFVTDTFSPHYRKHPSDLRVVVSLELAILERNMDKWSESQQRLVRAIRDYQLEQIDFRSDASVRRELSFMTPLIRPEVALLFLAAEDARRSGNIRQAASWYRLLIERAPVSPYAWESLVRLKMLPDIKATEISRHQQTLLSFYPCVWGYAKYPLRHMGDDSPLDISRERFAKQYLPKMLSDVEKEVRAVDAWLKQQQNQRNGKKNPQ